MTAHCAPPIDQFASYCEKMKRVYGRDCPLMTRERWDAACMEPRGRKLTDDQFDDNLFSMENGDGEIY